MGDLIAGRSVTEFWLDYIKTRLAELRENCRDELIDGQCLKWQLEENWTGSIWPKPLNYRHDTKTQTLSS